MTPFEALYGRPCKSPSCWLETIYQLILSVEMIHDTLEIVYLIQKRMKASQDRQKSFADKRHTDLELFICDLVFVKILPLKKVVRFNKGGKLAPKFIGLFHILEQIISI